MFSSPSHALYLKLFWDILLKKEITTTCITQWKITAPRMFFKHALQTAYINVCLKYQTNSIFPSLCLVLENTFVYNLLKKEKNNHASIEDQYTCMTLSGIGECSHEGFPKMSAQYNVFLKKFLPFIFWHFYYKYNQNSIINHSS